ncbi:hypothetical protein HanRHA438_Chr09g0378771 [Helianthus annuus]|nr:hypothetical protein HanRHA438_Chr09g0378771 [Helianthus annuus]
MSYNNESQPSVGAPPQLNMSYNNESHPPVSAPPPLGYPTNPVPEDAPQQLQQDQQRGVPRQVICCW